MRYYKKAIISVLALIVLLSSVALAQNPTVVPKQSITIHVQTTSVPAVAGATVEMNKAKFVTNANGDVIIQIPQKAHGRKCYTVFATAGKLRGASTFKPSETKCVIVVK